MDGAYWSAIMSTPGDALVAIASLLQRPRLPTGLRHETLRPPLA
jgi:hypothetical protein